MSQAFFSQPVVCPRPYALMDLDDTLFQTKRKLDQWQLPTDALTVATLDKQGEPLSFFTAKQAQFFAWLSQTTELIPITARDTQEIKRVKLPFHSWQVLTHGAVIVQPNGKSLEAWQSVMVQALTPLQAPMSQLYDMLNTEFSALNLRVTPHCELFNGVPLTVYLAIKQVDKDHTVLLKLAEKLPTLSVIDQAFYVHVNANNLAILPHAVHKREAVKFLLHELDPTRPSFGFGDSVTDLAFLQCLDWYGTPNKGQLHDTITVSLQDSL